MTPPAGSVFEPVDAEVRRRAVGVDAADRRGRLLVEAAAGTGKTTVLVERVLRTVRAGDQPLAKIAVVTFTEAAAAELKQRLRDEFARQLAAPAAADPAEHGRLRQALADLETAAVGTIHAFCMELLKQRPVEAGVDPGFQVADAFQQRILKARAWETMLRGMRPGEAGVAGRGLEAAFDLGLAHEPELRRIAFRLVNVDPQRLPEPDRSVLEGWAERWSALGVALVRAHALASAGGALAKNMAAALTAFEELAAVPTREQQRVVLEGELKIYRRGGTQAEEEAKLVREEAIAHRDELAAALAHTRLAEVGRWLAGLGEIYRQLAEREGWLDFDGLIRRALATLQGQPHVLADFQRRYPVLLVDEFQDTDPLQTELILLLASAPKSSPEPTAGDGETGPRSLFLVGDPKQSIYRFRGADLENYNRVLAEAIGPRRLVVLKQSFRPLPALAAWVNEVMARVMAPATAEAGELAAGEAAGADGMARYEAPYRELVARVPEATPELSGALYLEIVFPAGNKSAGGGIEAAREAEAEAWARLIHRLVAGGQVGGPDGGSGGAPAQVRERTGGSLRRAAYGDIALLLPKLTVLDSYERVFHRHGIPLRVIGGRHYYRRDEVHALLTILRALADPADPVAVVAALRGPGFAVSDAALAAWALCRPRPRFEAIPKAAPPALGSSPDPRRAAEVAAALELLRELHAATLGKPLAELVEEVLAQTGLVAFFALQWRGQQRVANLRKVVAVARRVEAAGVAALSAFVRWLEGLLEEEPDESDSPYLEGSGAAVRVMTVHGAKGLEFPIVLLGGLPSGGGRGPGGLQVLERGDGGLALVKSKSCQTLGADEARQRDARRAAAETKRLLYVAATRARDLLVLPLAKEDGVAQGELFQALYAAGAGRPETLTVAHRRWVADELPAIPRHEPEAALDLAALTAAQPGSAPLAETMRRRAEVLAIAARPSAASLLRPSDAESLPDLEGAEPEVAGDENAAEARRAAFRIGDAAHLLLETEMAGGQPAQLGSGGDAVPGSGFATANLPPRLTASEERTARALASRFLATALYRRARAAGPARRFAELTVTLPVPPPEIDGSQRQTATGASAPQVLDGQIDLAFLEADDGGDDGWVIVDYKTDRLAAGEEPRRAESYVGQLALYAEALARVSGLPVREVHLAFLATGGTVALPVAAAASGRAGTHPAEG